MKLRLIAGAALAASILLASGVAFSHSGATGVVKHRMDAMSDIAKSMKAIGAMIKGETGFDAATVKASADSIAEHAARMPELFPEGSTKKPSEALPAIWEDWARFTTIAQDMGTKGKALAAAADGASQIDQIKAPFGALAKTCKACHSDFRLAK